MDKKHESIDVHTSPVNAKQDKPKETHTRYIIIKLLKTKEKKNLESSKNKKKPRHLTYMGKTVHDQKSWRLEESGTVFFKVSKKIIVNLGSHSEKIPLGNERRSRHFADERKLRESAYQQTYPKEELKKVL